MKTFLKSICRDDSPSSDLWCWMRARLIVAVFFFSSIGLCFSQTLQASWKLEQEKFCGVKFQFDLATNRVVAGGTNYLNCTIVNSTTNTIIRSPIIKVTLTNDSGACCKLECLNEQRYRNSGPRDYGIVRIGGNDGPIMSFDEIKSGETYKWQEPIVFGKEIKPDKYNIVVEQPVVAPEPNRYAALFVTNAVITIKN